MSKRTRKRSPRTVCSMSSRIKPKREAWFEPRRNHSAEGLRCILPVLTAEGEREREGVCDVLNGFDGMPPSTAVAAAHWQNEPGHGGFSRSQNEPEHTT